MIVLEIENSDIHSTRVPMIVLELSTITRVLFIVLVLLSGLTPVGAQERREAVLQKEKERAEERRAMRQADREVALLVPVLVLLLLLLVPLLLVRLLVPLCLTEGWHYYYHY